MHSKNLLPLLLLAAAIPTQAQVTDKIDWPAFMSRHDMVWTQMPTAWIDGAFQGNGELGAMIFASDDGAALRWRIGRTDVVYKGVRIPIGDLLLKPVGKIQGLSMRLDLWNAEITGTLRTSAGTIAFRSFTHSTEMVQVIEFTPSAGETDFKVEWAPGLAVNPRDVYQNTPVSDADSNPPPQITNQADSGLSIQPLKTGGGHATAWAIDPGADGSRLLLLSVGYSTQPDKAPQEATAAISKAESEGIDALVKSHRDWWHQFYPESFVSIPDTRLESFYWIQMYKMASGTRPGLPALDLMGPWFNRTPWPKIWWNLNIQLTYWPELTSNRLELGQSLCTMLNDHADALAKNAGKWSSDSAAIGRSSSYDCVRSVSGPGDELCDLPWTLHDYWLINRYAMDDAQLRDHLFPLLKRSMNYYIHLLVKGPDGKLHIHGGFSPEYPDQPKNETDCNIDLALLRWGCQTLLDTCDRLKIDDPLIPKWREVLADLTPYPIDENGLRISAEVSFAQSHRHYSHLLMIYPLYLMNWDQPQNRPLIQQSLAHFTSLPKGWKGFSYSGAASMEAMMGNGDQAATYLNQFLDKLVHRNTMYTEAGPVIESPLSGAASINDMLLTSWGNKIRVFPAIPKTWPDVTIENLRAQGAFLVTAARKNGQTQFIRIQSLAGEPCRVWTDIPDPVADNNVSLQSAGDGTWDIALKKGDSVTLHPRGATPDFVIEAVAPQTARMNFYGVH